MRLNLGSGEFPLDGWTNVDMFCPADVQGDMRLLDFEGVTQVEMNHSLEHIPWPDVLPLVERIRGWMLEGGTIRIEVPDMREIMRRGEELPLWMIYTYGAQAPHQGEAHMSGYTEGTLRALLTSAGFGVSETREFLSDHPYRPEMPCLEARAVAV